jgi:hypothetical protein
MPFRGIVDEFAARAGSACSGCAANDWNDRLRISTKRAECGACTSGVT